MRVKRGSIPDNQQRQETAGSLRLWGLLAIVLLGVIFRVPRLTESLWYDEIASWQVYCANAASPLAIVGNFGDPINHVLSNVLMWCSVNSFSSWTGVEMAFRLPALFFSLLSIVAMYGLGSRAGGIRVGFIAAGLMAVLPVAALEGVEARGYSMMMCFAAVSMWMLVSVLRRKRLWLWVAYAIVCTLGVWAQFITAFVPIGHAAWLMWRADRHRVWRDCWQGFAALVLAAILTLALYSPMIPAMLKSRGMFIATHPDQPRIFGTEGLHTLLQLGGSWYWWAAVPGLAIGVIGLLVAIRSDHCKSQTCDAASGIIAASLLGLPIMLLVVAASGSWIYARFTLFAFPGAVLLMAIGIDWLWRINRGLAGFALMLMVGLSIADLRFRPPKQPLREAMEYVREHQHTSDSVLAIGLAHPVSLAYASDVHLSYTMKHGTELAARLADLHPRWLIIEYPRSVSPKTFDLIRESGFIEQRRLPGWVDWGNGEIIVMRRP